MSSPTFEQGAARVCRICLQESVGDEYISPCGCRGSLEHIHSECLKKWIRKSRWKHRQDKDGQYIYCEMCVNKIYFTIESEKWASWYRTKPCSAIFYVSWIVLLALSLVGVVFLVVYGIVTGQYEVMRFMGLPLGFFLVAGFLFIKCSKDFRDYQTGIIYIKSKQKSSKKNNSHALQPINSSGSLIT